MLEAGGVAEGIRRDSSTKNSSSEVSLETPAGMKEHQQKQLILHCS
jgi:hypothetical protein